MDQLIATLYEMTLAMNSAFEEENYEELEKLLDQRYEIMSQIDILKSEKQGQGYPFSPQANALLKEIHMMDQQLNSKLTVNLEQTESLINQTKLNKQVSKKFLPYSNQTSGIFVDAKK
jgi:hypothetical protein